MVESASLITCCTHRGRLERFSWFSDTMNHERLVSRTYYNGLKGKIIMRADEVDFHSSITSISSILFSFFFFYFKRYAHCHRLQIPVAFSSAHKLTESSLFSTISPVTLEPSFSKCLTSTSFFFFLSSEYHDKLHGQRKFT